MYRYNTYMAISVTRLRSDLYRMIDQVLLSGKPLEVERNGRTVLISPVPAESKLAALVARPSAIAGDPEELVHWDWSGEWKP